MGLRQDAGEAGGREPLSVRAANALTARWASFADARGTVFSGVAVWPLLAFLASGADGPAGVELQDATGLTTGEAADAGRELVAALDALPGVGAAVGLWLRHDLLRLRPAWEESLPPGTRGALTGDKDADLAVMGEWASGHTDGLVREMPVPVDDATRLVLASALLVRTDWLQPFDAWPCVPEAGPWAGRTVKGLWRSSRTLDRLRVHYAPGGTYTVMEVVGGDGISVYLALGPESASPGEVVAEALTAASGAGLHWVKGGDLPYGDPAPGVTVTSERSTVPEPRLDLRTVEFTVEADHDLLAYAEVFGLASAEDASRGHFPGISDSPLAVQHARQRMTATFGPVGFRAAAVTAVAAMPGAAPPPATYDAKRVAVRFERPFGFVAAHRASGLVLAAGWVSETDAG